MQQATVRQRQPELNAALQLRGGLLTHVRRGRADHTVLVVVSDVNTTKLLLPVGLYTAAQSQVLHETGDTAQGSTDCARSDVNSTRTEHAIAAAAGQGPKSAITATHAEAGIHDV